MSVSLLVISMYSWANLNPLFSNSSCINTLAHKNHSALLGKLEDNPLQNSIYIYVHISAANKGISVGW